MKFAIEIQSITSVPLDIVATYGEKATWLELPDGGSVTFKDGTGLDKTITSAPGDRLDIDVRHISSSPRVRIGTTVETNSTYKSFISEYTSVDSTVDLVATFGRVADWLSAEEDGPITFEDSSASTRTFIARRGDVWRMNIRKLFSSHRVQIGSGLPPSSRTMTTVQQMLDGVSLSQGNTAIVGSNPVETIVFGPGDSTSLDYHTRERAALEIVKLCPDVQFAGTEGMALITGGLIGRRVIPAWAHLAVSGYRLYLQGSATVDATANTLTATGLGIALNKPCVIVDAGDTNLLVGHLYYAKNISGNAWELTDTQGGATIDITGNGPVIVGTGFVQMWEGIADRLKLAGVNPTCFFPLLGINDIIGGATGAQCLDWYSQLIDKMLLSFPSARIIMHAPHPITQGSSSGGSWAAFEAQRVIYEQGLQTLRKGPNVGYFPISADVVTADIDPDGIHLNTTTRTGQIKKGIGYAKAMQRVLSVSPARPYNRTRLKVPGAAAALTLGAVTHGAIANAYHASQSPARDDAGNLYTLENHPGIIVGWTIYPTSLAEDSVIRPMVWYADVHPAGFMIGTRAAAGAAGGVVCYYGTSGGVFSGFTAGSYAANALALNDWNECAMVFLPKELLCGFFNNGQLIGWFPIVSPFPIVSETQKLGIGQRPLSVASVRDAQQGHYCDVYLAKSTELNSRNAYNVVRNAYIDHAFPRGTKLWYPFSAGTGTTEPAKVTGQPVMDLQSGTTWTAAASLPARPWAE